MNERIQRLKKNLARYDCLDPEEQECLQAAGKWNTCTLHGNGEWLRMQSGGPWHKDTIYRLIEDYNPKPGIPQFPGYVLWPVEHGVYTKTHENRSETRICLHEAVNFGCAGYVFKEWPHRCFNTPIMFVNLDGQPEYECVGNIKPATLGWVRFKEQGGGGE